MALEDEVKKQKAKNRILKNKGKPQKVYNLVKDYNDNDKEPKGKPTCICKRCKKEFEQDYVPDRNAYTDWKTCGPCRKLLAEEKSKTITKTEKEVSVAKLHYEPFNWQIEAAKAFEEHRFIVLSCGNRTGKDRFSIMTGIKYFVECLNENRAIEDPTMVPPVMWWIIAPIEPLARQIWRELRTYFPKEWIVACSNSSYQMETIGGGVIEVRSGYNEDMLVGVGLDLVTITEAARFKDLEFAWANLEGRLNSAGRGRIKDRGGKLGGKGKAIINSSPLPGKNGFYRLFCYGQKGHPNYSSDWWSCQYPWTANPYNVGLAKEIRNTRFGKMTYEEVLIRQLGERLYKLNYLGQFAVEDGAVFKTFEEKCVININDDEATGTRTKKEKEEYKANWKRAFPGEIYVAGYDPATGSSGDSPVLVIRHKATGRVVRAYDLYGKNYDAQYDFIESICKMFNYAEVHWLRTGHTAIEGVFAKRGLTEIAIDENGQNKGKLVQTLELAVENGDVHVLMDGSREIQTLIYQMNDYTEKNGKYANNEQDHDDYVSALYAAFSDYVAYECPVGYGGMFGGLKIG